VSQRKSKSARGVGLLAGLTMLLGFALWVATASAAPPGHTTTVSETPRGNTPEFLDNEVRGLLQVGDTVIIGGSYTQVRSAGVTYNQPNLSAYNVNTGNLLTAFLPTLDGAVYSMADAGNGEIVVVGKFSTVNGQKRYKVAKLRLSDGSLVTEFTANASTAVFDVAVNADIVYLGGGFSTINGVERLRIAAVSNATGALDPNFDLPVTFSTGYRGSTGAVRSLDISPDGTRLLIAYNSRFIDGQKRPGVAQVDIASTPAAVLPWSTSVYEPYCQRTTYPLLRDAKYSPDGSYFVVVSAIGNFAPSCDVANRFETNGGPDSPATWIGRIFDTPEAVAISEVAVYVGGHMRWAMAPGTTTDDYANGNRAVIPGAVPRYQIMALDPADGTGLPWNPGATGQRGVLALEVTPRGLLAGSDGPWFGPRETFRSALFELAGAPVDDVAPETVADTPVDNADVAASFVASGSASDNVAVGRVRFSVRNRDTGQWLQADGSFAAWSELSAQLGSPGTPATTWSMTLTDLPPGRYRMIVKAEDSAGNVDPTAVNTRFNVIDTADVEAPVVQVLSPVDNGTVPAGSVTVTGDITDDVAVDAVRVSVRDRDTGQWLQADGTFGAWAQLDGVVATPGAVSSDWTFTATLPAARYSIYVTGLDAAGKPSSRVKSRFVAQ
jgi:Domain of unknown function (DUF5122) beta-propeller